MNNAFAIDTADTELVYIITFGAGAAIIARNASAEILRFGVEQCSDVFSRSHISVDLKRKTKMCDSAIAKRVKKLNRHETSYHDINLVRREELN